MDQWRAMNAKILLLAEVKQTFSVTTRRTNSTSNAIDK
jgi:hypothetical protein